MGFKKDNDLGNIGDILEKNHTKNQKKVGLKKKVRETTKPVNFSMKPSVRKKLDWLKDYDADYSADSASSYISEFIEKRYSELNLE